MLKQLKLVKHHSGKLAATSTLALLGLGLANQGVQADELTPSQPLSPAASTATKSNTAPNTIAGANAAVANAQAQANRTAVVLSTREGDVSSQLKVVEIATSETSKLQADLASAVSEHSEAVMIKSQATPEFLSATTSEIASATSALASETATAAVDQSAVDSQSVVVASASATASAANVASSEATSKLDELTSLVEAPGKIAQDLVSAKANLARLEQEISVAEGEVSSATTAAIATVSKQLEAKVAELSAKQAELSALKLANPSSTSTPSKDSIVGGNKITLPSTYKSQVLPALTAIENGGWTYSDSYNSAVAQYANQIESGAQAGSYGSFSALNSYKSIAADAGRTIDPNNLSEAVQNEVAQFVEAILNGVRGELGLAAVTVTKTVQEMAAAIATEYRRAGFGILNNPHSSTIIGKAASSVGLKPNDNRGYESLGFFGKPTTVDQLKASFYNGIVYMLFNDGGSKYGHTISLLQNSNKGPYYLGISATSNAQHIYMVPSANIANPAQFSTKSISGTTTSVDNSAKIKAVELAMKTLEAEIAALKSNNTDVSNVGSVVRAKEKLANLKAQLSTSRENVTKLTALANKLTANKSQLAKNLEDAKQVNARRLQEKIDAQDKLTKELKKLQELKATSDASAVKVNALKARVATLQGLLEKANDPKLLEKADEKLRKATSALESAKAKLATEVKTLELLKAKRNVALKGHAAAQASLEQSKAHLATLVTKSPSTNQENQVVSLPYKPSLQTQSSVSTVSEKSNPIKKTTSTETLPKTGEASEALTMVAAATMVSLAALVLSKKRYH